MCTVLFSDTVLTLKFLRRRALGLAYDLCYDAWSTETRQTVADSLLDLASRALSVLLGHDSIRSALAHSTDGKGAPACVAAAIRVMRL